MADSAPASACQRPAASCGSCCGMFVLDQSPSERAALLRTRTAEFAQVDVRDARRVSAYRARREQIESAYPRHDTETYVCPFLGYLTEGTRVGCLIHPARTGIPDSQRFSFYGAAICAAYDCRVKAEDDGSYAALLERSFPASEDYARLIADHAFYTALLKCPDIWRRTADEPRVRNAFELLCRARLKTESSRGLTSFEIRFRYFEDPLVEFLHLLHGAEAAERARASGHPPKGALALAIGILLDRDVA